MATSSCHGVVLAEAGHRALGQVFHARPECGAALADAAIEIETTAIASVKIQIFSATISRTSGVSMNEGSSFSAATRSERTLSANAASISPSSSNR
jgi:hypothetical protein